MRVIRLGSLLEAKYNLISNADVNYNDALKALHRVKKELNNLNHNYLRSGNYSYNILPYLSSLGEPNSTKIISLLNYVIENYDELMLKDVFNKINEVLYIISTLQENGSKVIRNSIHDSFVISKHVDKNNREAAKSKWEQVVNYKVANILNKLAKELLPYLDVQVSILGGAVDPKRKELSRQTLWFFIHGNYAAIKYGLDDEYVFNKLYDDLEVREKLTTLINAVSRGKIPKDGPEVMAAAKEIKKIYDSRLINNTGFFEANEDEAKKQLDTDVLTPEEAFPVDMQKGKLEKKREIEENNPSSETPEEAEFRLQKEILLRDQEHDERINKNKENMIEEDRDRHVRSEGSLLMRNFIKRYLK